MEYPQDAAWYKKNAAVSKLRDQDFADGFGLELSALNRLKGELKFAREQINPENALYKGNRYDIKEKHAAAFLNRWPQFSRPPEDWRTNAICALMNRVDHLKGQKAKVPKPVSLPQDPTPIQPTESQANPTYELPIRTPTLSPSHSVPSQAHHSTARPLRPSEITLCFVSFQGETEIIHGEVLADLLLDRRGMPSWEDLCDEAAADDSFGFQGLIFMPERDRGGVPIRTAIGLCTALNSVSQLGLRNVRVTTVDNPSLRRQHKAQPKQDSGAPSKQDEQKLTPMNNTDASKRKATHTNDERNPKVPKTQGRNGTHVLQDMLVPEFGHTHGTEDEEAQATSQSDRLLEDTMEGASVQVVDRSSRLTEDTAVDALSRAVNESRGDAKDRTGGGIVANQDTLQRATNEQETPNRSVLPVNRNESEDRLVLSTVPEPRKHRNNRRNPEQRAEVGSSEDEDYDTLPADARRRAAACSEDKKAAASGVKEAPIDVESWAAGDRLRQHAPPSESNAGGDSREETLEESGESDENDETLEFLVEDEDNVERELKMLAQLQNEEQERTLQRKLARVEIDVLQRATQLLPWLTVEQLKNTEGIVLHQLGLNDTIQVSPYQIISATEGFVQEQSVLGGGILGDEAGAGKTLQLILKFVLRTVHKENVEAVKRAREQGDTAAHLPEGAPSDASCPSRSKNAIACWCEPKHHGPLFQASKEPLAGCYLIVTPRSGLDSFYNDLVKLLDGSRFLDRFSTRIAFHDSSNGSKRFSRFPPLAARELPRYCRGYDRAKFESDWRNREDHKTWKNRKGEDLEYQWTFQQHPNRSGWEQIGTREVDQPPRDTSHLVLITTPGCFEAQVLHATSVTIEAAGVAGTRHRETLNLLVIAYVMYDECHLAVNGQQMTLILEAAQSSCRATFGEGNFPIVWGASGTPQGNNMLNSLAFCRQALFRPAWLDERDRDDPLHVLAKFDMSAEGMISLGKKLPALYESVRFDIESLQKVPRYQSIQALYQPAAPLFIIRRTLDCPWFNGRSIVEIKCVLTTRIIQVKPNPTEADVVMKGEQALRAEVQRQLTEAIRVWREDGARPNAKPKPVAGHHIQGYVTTISAASIPAVVSWWQEARAEEELQGEFTKEHPLLQPMIKRPRHEETIDMLKRCGMLQTAKFVELRRILVNIASKRRTDGKRSKVLIASKWPVTLAALKGALEVYFPGNVADYTADLPTKDRGTSLDKFCNTKDGQDQTWILLATVATVGVGLNLQCAHHAILYEPSCSAHTVEQFFKRVCRRGQTEPTCHGYILVNGASAMEKRVARKMEFMGELHAAIAQTAIKDNDKAEDEVEEVEMEI
ncbi:hypothetical protein N0V90_011234 [Kalmusia sp. IMI 367209]|nr:hypothetical protein N0V90_011234 [Kalmusia sp. IMI 367209]